MSTANHNRLDVALYLVAMGFSEKGLSYLPLTADAKNVLGWFAFVALGWKAVRHQGQADDSEGDLGGEQGPKA